MATPSLSQALARALGSLVEQQLRKASEPFQDFNYETCRIIERNGTSQIRLLEILESGSRASQQISIRLLPFHLDNTIPSYLALSYSWGDPSQKMSIVCNGQRIEIGRSLHEALTALRRRRVRNAFQPRYMWIDALCINQNSNREKEHQLPLMVKIYEQASHVLVWLGPPDVDSQLGLPFMRLCAATVNTTAGMNSTQDFTPQDWANIGFHMPEQERVQRTRALTMFFKRPWFRRMWIVQEFAVARSVTCMCGDEEFSPSELDAATQFATNTEAGFVPATEEVDGDALPFGKLVLLRTDWERHQKMPLLTLLQDHRSCHASDPRDKIYSIMHMAKDIGPRFHGLHIEKGYDIDAATLYRITALEMMIKQRSLEVLTHAGVHEVYINERRQSWDKPGYHERLPDLPSWVPDWHLPDSTQSLLRFERPQRYSGIWSSGEVVNNLQAYVVPYSYCASGSTSFRYSPSSNEAQLKVRGMLLDVISSVGRANHNPRDLRPVPTNQNPSEWLRDPNDAEIIANLEQTLGVFQNWHDLIMGTCQGQLYFTQQPMFEVLWQTMMAGIFPHGIEAERSLFLQWYKATEKTRVMVLGLQHNPLVRMAALSIYTSLKMASGGIIFSSNFMRKTSGTTLNRAVFRTAGHSRHGELIGLAPRGTAPGDFVVILEGATVPFVLRPWNGNWKLVGACYLHGGMFGDLFDSMKCVDLTLV